MRASHRAELNAYISMVGRCYRPHIKAFKYYGARGITVCTRWLEGGAGVFLEDMGPRPSAKHSLERIDNDAGYSPENCRWATRPEQYRNRRSNVWVTYKGERMTINEFADLVGINRVTIAGRRREWGVSGSEIDGENLLMRRLPRKREGGAHPNRLKRPRHQE